MLMSEMAHLKTPPSPLNFTKAVKLAAAIELRAELGAELDGLGPRPPFAIDRGPFVEYGTS